MHSIKIKLLLLVPMKRIRERRINVKLKGEIYKIINCNKVARAKHHHCQIFSASASLSSSSCRRNSEFNF